MRESGFESPSGAATGYDPPWFSDAPTISDGRSKPTDAEGGLWSTAGDLARWIAFQLDGDPTVLPGEVLRELHWPAVITNESWTGAQGLAWYHERRGERIYVGHSGGTPGFSARIAFSPPESSRRVLWPPRSTSRRPGHLCERQLREMEIRFPRDD